MKLAGIIETGLGGFTTIRGYASLADLVKISKPEEFQRVLIESHLLDLQEFYRKRNALYFPEIVLAYTMRYDFAMGISGTNPMQDIIEKRDFKSNVEPISIKAIKIEPRGQRIAEIRIDDDWLETHKPFSIIDGNHRISAFLDGSFHIPYEPYTTPFSLILFEENDRSKKNKKLIFHNINSKARKLTTEEELKSIICDNDFTDKELENDFGKEYVLVRELSNLLPNSQLANILSNLFPAFKAKDQSVLKNSVLFKIVSFLHKNLLIDKTTSAESISEALQEVNNEFYNFVTLKHATNPALFIAALGIKLNVTVSLKSFAVWLSQNHLAELLEIKEQSLYDIYLKLNEKRPKLFVAMPYFSKDEVLSYNEMYQRVVAKINYQNIDVNLELFPIMIHEGGTKDVVVHMLNQINGCTIFVADISSANSNVAYELGYARSKDIRTIIVRREGDDTKIPFDYEHDVRSPYNPLALHTLEESVYRDIKAILIEKGYKFNS